MKKRVARWLVQRGSSWVSTSYYVWTRCDRGHWPKWVDFGVMRLSHSLCEVFLKAARRIDTHEAVEQMAEEEWWG